jgi:hypothetical protein
VWPYAIYLLASVKKLNAKSEDAHSSVSCGKFGAPVRLAILVATALCVLMDGRSGVVGNWSKYIRAESDDLLK